jgi:hypothetical protein
MSTLDSFLVKGGKDVAPWGKRFISKRDFSVELSTSETFRDFLLTRPREVPTLSRISDIWIKGVNTIPLLLCHFDTKFGEKKLWMHATFLHTSSAYRDKARVEERRLKNQIAGVVERGGKGEKGEKEEKEEKEDGGRKTEAGGVRESPRAQTLSPEGGEVRLRGEGRKRRKAASRCED